MPIKGVALPGVTYSAFNFNSNMGQTGDANNHTLKLVLDGAETIPMNHPVEVDSVNLPGVYKLDLQWFETQATLITLAGKSSTAGVSIIGFELVMT